MIDLLPVIIQALALAAVVAGSHVVCAELSGLLEEGRKLDLAVAQHIRVGGPPFCVLVEHIVHHPFAVLFAQVHKIEGYAYFARYHLGYEAVLLPLAVSVQSAFGVVPILHKHRKHIIALLFEKQSGHTGVHTSRQSYANLHKSKTIVK